MTASSSNTPQRLETNNPRVEGAGGGHLVAEAESMFQVAGQDPRALLQANRLIFT